MSCNLMYFRHSDRPVKVIHFLVLISCLSAQVSVVAASRYAERRVELHAFKSLAQIKSPLQKTEPGIQPPQRPPVSDEVTKSDAVEAQRRTFGASLITSLIDEARSYKDLALRARVLARAADALWDDDPNLARTVFRQAWEAAEKADAVESVGASNSSTPVMIIALRRRGGGDSRTEVLNRAARRDPALGKELLGKLIEAASKTGEQATDQTGRPVNDSWTTSDETSTLLSLAQRLLEENEAEKAFAFAAPALDRVNEKVINFLSRLRLVKPALADKQFMALLARAELDPTADANTVSGLSSYAFTPGLYVTFGADGGVRWTPALETIAAPDLPPEVRSSFFRVAADILLRPLPPPDQDLTSAGLAGKYMVIKRLLPLFEQNAPNTAVALQSQLTALAQQASRSVVDDDDFLLSQGIMQEADSRTVVDRMQERVDKAKNDRERDEIYMDAAAVLAAQGNPVAQEIADKVENVYRREMVRRYVDISLVRAALKKRNATLALRFAKADSLMHSHRTWAYLQIARLLKDSNRTQAVELLEESLNEARRIDAEDANRALLIVGVATQFLTLDSVRSWEVAAEAIKAANAAEEFSGEPNDLTVGLMTRSGFKLMDLDTSALNLSALVSSLAKQDLVRASDLAKNFKRETPRAVATLAVASAAMAKTGRKK